VSTAFSFVLSHISLFFIFFWELIFWLALFFLNPNVQICLKMINDWLYSNVEKKKGKNYVDELNWTKNEKGYVKYYILLTRFETKKCNLNIQGPLPFYQVDGIT